MPRFCQVGRGHRTFSGVWRTAVCNQLEARPVGFMQEGLVDLPGPRWWTSSFWVPAIIVETCGQ